MRHLNLSFPNSAVGNIQDWKRLCANSDRLVAIQLRFWHLRKLASFTQMLRQTADKLVKNLVKFDYSVLKAFSPYFAGAYFVRNKTDGWRSLGGILLAFTGVEALFADLGAFTIG